MDLEFIDISREEERSASGGRNKSYVSGSAVRSERPVSGNPYQRRRPVPGSNRREAAGRPMPGNRRRADEAGRLVTDRRRADIDGRPRVDNAGRPMPGSRRRADEAGRLVPDRRRADTAGRPRADNAGRPVPGNRRRMDEAGRPVRRSGSEGRRTSNGQVSRTPEEIERRRQRILQKRKIQRQRKIMKGVILFCESAFVILLCILLYQFVRSFQGTSGEQVVKRQQESQAAAKVVDEKQLNKPTLTEDFLTVNPYSRPGEKLESVNNIFVHYTANKGTSAAQNRSYFENLGITGETSASAHFIIGFDGEIIQCVPLDEIAYAVMRRNYDSVSIECCYLEDDGKFTDATYQSLIRLCAWLLDEYNLSPEDILRHYDEGGKKCPLYFVEHAGDWEQFKKDVNEYLSKEPTV